MTSNSYPEPDSALKYERLKGLLNEHPSCGELLVRVREIPPYRVLNNPSEAVGALRKAQLFCPEKDLRLRLGDALSRSGEEREGIYQMYQFLQSNPTAFGYRVLARHLLAKDKFARACKILRRALLIQPKNAETYYLLGDVLYKKSKKGAVTYYRKAIELDLRLQEAWQSLGMTLIQDPSTRREGLEALKRAIELDPEDVLAHVAGTRSRAGQRNGEG